MSENLKGFSYYSFLDDTYSLTPGAHIVTLYSAGWDNLVQVYPPQQFTLTVGSKACPALTGLNVCSPLPFATVSSPVHAWASGSLPTSISRMEIWVDGVKKFSTFGSNTLDTSIPVEIGAHEFTYYLVGTDGTKTLTTERISVR